MLASSRQAAPPRPWSGDRLAIPGYMADKTAGSDSGAWEPWNGVAIERAS
jgi:hypothetical protein